MGNENITLQLEKVAQEPGQPGQLRERPGKEGKFSMSGGKGRGGSPRGGKWGQPKPGRAPGGRQDSSSIPTDPSGPREHLTQGHNSGGEQGRGAPPAAGGEQLTGMCHACRRPEKGPWSSRENFTLERSSARDVGDGGSQGSLTLAQLLQAATQLQPPVRHLSAKIPSLPCSCTACGCWSSKHSLRASPGTTDPFLSQFPSPGRCMQCLQLARCLVQWRSAHL